MSNYPAGVTDQTIDDYFGPDEPESEDVIVPADILERLIEDACEDNMAARGLPMLLGAKVYLILEGRYYSDGIAAVALARFLAGDRNASVKLDGKRIV